MSRNQHEGQNHKIR